MDPEIKKQLTPNPFKQSVHVKLKTTQRYKYKREEKRKEDIAMVILYTVGSSYS